MPRQDDILDAIYRGLEEWATAERNLRNMAIIAGERRLRRVDRRPDGTHIPAPRRGAMARFLTDRVLTALRDDERNPE